MARSNGGGRDMRPLYRPLYNMYQEGLSYREMASYLKITIGSVAGTLYRMRQGSLQEWKTPLKLRKAHVQRGYENRWIKNPLHKKPVTLPKLKFMEDWNG